MKLQASADPCRERSQASASQQSLIMCVNILTAHQADRGSESEAEPLHMIPLSKEKTSGVSRCEKQNRNRSKLLLRDHLTFCMHRDDKQL